MANTNREPAWDFIKVYAALGVVLAHVVSPMTHGGDVSLNFIFANALDSLSRPAVGMFFCIAGMFAIAKYEAFWKSKSKLSFIAQYYLRSFNRTILPAGAAILFYSVLIGGKHDALDSLTGFVNIFRCEAILSSPGYHLWFMYVLCFLMLLSPLFWLLLGIPSGAGEKVLRALLMVWFALAVVWTSCYYYLGWESAKPCVEFLNGHVILKNAGFYLLGFYIPKLRGSMKNNETFKKAVWRVFVVSVLITLAMPYILLNLGIDDPFHSYRDFIRFNICSITFSALLIMCGIPAYKYNPCEELTQTTYPIYLSHVFFIWLLNPWIKSLEYEIPVIGIVIEAAIVLACSYGFGRLYVYAASVLPKPWGKPEERAVTAPRKEPAARVTQSSSPYDVFGTATTRYDSENSVPQERRDYIAKARFEGLRNASDTPVLSRVVLCLTHRCQYDCIMCGLKKSGAAMEERDPQFWIELIESTQHPDVEFVLFGGEPLLYQGIDTVWDYLAANNLRFTTVTNGALVQRFAERFYAAGNARLTLSVDGFAKEHNAVRGNSQAFQRVAEFLRCTAKVKPSALDRIALNCVIQPFNLATPDYLPSFVNFFHNIGVRNVMLQHIQSPPLIKQRKTIEMWDTIFEDEPRTLPLPGGGVDLRLTQALLGNLREALLRIKREHPSDMPYVLPALSCQGRDLERYYLDPDDDTELESVEGFCLRPFNSPFILPNGAISLCPLGGYQTEKLASGCSFGKAWNGERAREFRKAVLKFEFSICKYCCDNYQ